jgi:TRAP-type C4-dicarboxylate transport system permease small subunit
MNIKQGVIRVCDKTSAWCGMAIGWLLMILTVMILVEVLTRYVLQSPLSISEEFGGYMMVAITFLGLGYTWMEGSHVRVELFTNMLPQKIQTWFRLISTIIATLFSLIMIKGCYDMVAQSYTFGERSATYLRTPLMWPQMTLILGSVLLFVQLIAETIKVIDEINHPDAQKKQNEMSPDNS